MQETTVGNAISFPFLDLPAELRRQVYRYFVQSPHAFVILSPRPAETRQRRFAATFPFNLLLTCSLINQEIRPLYFTVNRFMFILDRHNDTLSYLLEPRFRPSLRLIHTLRISIIRWGRKNFFQDSFIPFLEDCILNGGLRNLEIWLKDSWVASLDEGGQETQSWRMLRSLLRDPYLEKVSLWTQPSFRGGPSIPVGDEQPSNMIDVSWLLD